MELIYCANGNKQFAEIAIKHGLSYGAQLPGTVYYAPVFADQDHNKCKEAEYRQQYRPKYMAALKEHKPRMATVLDHDDNVTLDEVMSWAEEAADYVQQAVIIIPKVHNVIDSLPRRIKGKEVRLGYSVPTRYGGTDVMIHEFLGWPVHLLGGSPHKQYEMAGYLKPVSADGNYIQNAATSRNQFFSAGGSAKAKNRWFPQLQESNLGHIDIDTPALAFELSVMNLRAMWSGCTATIRFAVEGDIAEIQRISRQYRNELGYVSAPALRESISRRNLIVAEYADYIVGFANYRACRDGWQTIYEIGVRKGRQGEHIGAGLIAAIPAPIRLKCTADNVPANQFYERTGFIKVGIDPGAKRPLYVWRKVA